MKTTGTCPKCNSNSIYTDVTNMKRGDRCAIPISSWGKLFIDTYLCLDCGYVEEYICKEDLNDLKKREKLEANWKKVNS